MSKRLTLADGGYISWAYGTREGAVANWKALRLPYMRRMGGLVFLDCQNDLSIRAHYDPGYKQRRRDDRAADPEMAEKRAQVHAFTTNHLVRDETIHTVWAEGLEADDLVTLFYLMYRSQADLAVVGADKDLLQIPLIRMRHIDGEPITINDTFRRTSEKLRREVRRSRDILLMLVLMGDKSDSIPRIVPPREFAPLIRLFREPRPFRQALRYYGKQVVRNLYLATLPGPFCFMPLANNPDAVIDLVDSGEYWQVSSEHYQMIQPNLSMIFQDAWAATADVVVYDAV